MNREGQAFAVYKLLIGTVIALLILIIIIGAINYLEELKFDISRQRFITGLQQAVKQPNEDVFKIENVILKKGDFYSKASLGKVMGLEGDCIEPKAAESPAFELEDSDLVRIKQEILTDIYIQCGTGAGAGATMACSSGCDICCTVSFGEPLEKETN